jgi:hypothetical protein
LSVVRLPFPFARLLVLAVVLLAAASPASADEASPLARLSPEERAVLERRIPGLESLPREKQELLAQNVERLRSLDGAKRELLARRVKDARAADLGPEELDARRRSLKGLGGEKAQLAEWHGLGMKALGLVAWRDLPASVREHPALEALPRHDFMLAFHRKFWGQAVEGLDAREAAAAPVPDDLPGAWRERLQRARKAYEAAPHDPKAARQLRDVVLQGRVMRVLHRAQSAPPGGAERGGPEARLLRLGEVLRDVARPAYDATLAGLVRLAEEKGPERLAEKLAETARPPQPPPDVQKRLDAVRLVAALEMLNDVFQRQPELAPKADALLRDALVAGLGVAAADVDALPPRGDAERATRLRTLIEPKLPAGEWRREGLRRFGGQRGPGGFGHGKGPRGG